MTKRAEIIKFLLIQVIFMPKPLRMQRRRAALAARQRKKSPALLQKPAKRFRFFKRKRAGILAASALALVGGHIGAQQLFGRHYPKEIPLVRSIYADRFRFDFYFSPHATIQDSALIEPVIEGAKKSGKPYNVIVLEGGNIPKGRRPEWEAFENKLAKSCGTIAWGLKHSSEERQRLAAEISLRARALASKSGKPIEPNEETQKALRVLEEEVRKITGSSYSFSLNTANFVAFEELAESIAGYRANEETAATANKALEALKKYFLEESRKYGGNEEAVLGNFYQVFLAGGNDMRIKMGEEYSPEEKKRNRGIWDSMSSNLRKFSADPKNIEYRKGVVKSLALYIFFRDARIAETLEAVKKELADMPEFKGKQVRVLVTFGTLHLNAAKNFDWRTRSLVRIVGKEGRQEFLDEATGLSRRGLKAIYAY